MEGPDPAVLLTDSVGTWHIALGVAVPRQDREHSPRAHANWRTRGNVRGCLGKSQPLGRQGLYGHVGCRVGVRASPGHVGHHLDVGGLLSVRASSCPTRPLLADKRMIPLLGTSLGNMAFKHLPHPFLPFTWLEPYNGHRGQAGRPPAGPRGSGLAQLFVGPGLLHYPSLSGGPNTDPGFPPLF